jgi:hypothetical protein
LAADGFWSTESAFAGDWERVTRELRRMAENNLSCSRHQTGTDHLA